jgi:1-acyl-sn-glycerol-3-phosphate acyltransferase
MTAATWSPSHPFVLTETISIMARGLLVLLANLVLVPLLGGTGLVGSLVTGRRDPLQFAARCWGRALLRACGARVIVEGIERLERHRPAVVVANHSSNVDIYVVCAYSPRPFMIPAKAELFRIPLLGTCMHRLGMVPLERSRSARDLAQIDRLAEHLDERALLVFFPEGTRSRDGRLRRFKKGGFLIAIRHGVPVIPVAIAGASRMQRAGDWKVKAGPLRVRVLDPIPTTDLDLDDRNALRDEAHRRIAEALPMDQSPEGFVRDGEQARAVVSP